MQARFGGEKKEKKKKEKHKTSSCLSEVQQGRSAARPGSASTWGSSGCRDANGSGVSRH